MGKWLYLGGAIASEITATMFLRAAVDQPAVIPIVVAGYVLAYVFLGLTLRRGMPIGVGYGIWGAAGVAATCLLGWVIFGEALTVLDMVGVALIIAGVVLIETGAPKQHSTGPIEYLVDTGQEGEAKA